ncbi:MAG: N-formylglutamate amidohydrolase [Rhodospirillales bacterium]|nr:N-formylglutamate amidohydrolase [Rhodospirillales bacterium]
MNDDSSENNGPDAPCDVLAPERQTVPLVFASPHSGRRYPAEFVENSLLDALTIRRSEDSFVDELFAAAPNYGAPLLRAHFPRAFIDPNREPFELDPAMFEDELPDFANTQSSRVAAGLGTVARMVANGHDIYRGKLRFADIAERINAYYRPYHRTLRRLIDDTQANFGYCMVIDCHSMPSVGGPMDPDAGHGRADFILGDAFGSTGDKILTETVENTLRAIGHSVTRNKPFSGGYTTRHYGRPAEGVHAVQIEINRGLYMNEATITRGPGMALLQDHLSQVIGALAELGRLDLAAE